MDKFPPDWFNLENYDSFGDGYRGCGNFGRAQWALVINTRRKIHYDFINNLGSRRCLLDNLREASLNNHLALELKQPDFVYIGDGYSFTDYGWRWGISGSQLGTRMRSEWAFPRDEEEFEKEKQLGENAKYQLDSYEVGINEEIEDRFLESCYLANFDFSDEQLIRDFKVWLALKRRCHINQFQRDKKNETALNEKIGKELSQTIKARLHEQRILPYMDLYLYVLISGIKNPTYVEMAEVLFPPDAIEWIKDYGEVLRETIHPRAIQMLESTVLIV